MTTILCSTQNKTNEKSPSIQEKANEIGSWLNIMRKILTDAESSYAEGNKDSDVLDKIRNLVTTGSVCIDQHSSQRPLILFNDPMAEDILFGTKTQTRRVVKLPEWVETVNGKPHCLIEPVRNGIVLVEWSTDTAVTHQIECPYGSIGDKILVSKSWCEEFECAGSDSDSPVGEYFEGTFVNDDGKPEAKKWKTSTHASGSDYPIQLEITGIRVERLQDISEDDAIAEGIEGYLGNYKDYSGDVEGFLFAKQSYRTLWPSINRTDSWDDNPWVWVIKFKRI